MKIAEIYLKGGEKKRAVSEYLKSAEIFAQKGLYPQAMAVYKQIQRQNPILDEVSIKIADIYRRMGFLGDALAQYTLLLSHYNSLGLEEKAHKVMILITELDSRNIAPEVEKGNLQGRKLPGETKFHDGISALPLMSGTEIPAKEKKEDLFDLGAELEGSEPFELKDLKEISTEKIHGFSEILNQLKESSALSKVYPDFNYRMGVACHEMGFLDEAIEQFQIALDRKQAPFEAAKSLGVCYKEKNWWQEAYQSFERALRVEGIAPEQRMEVKKDLDFVAREQKKVEASLDFDNGTVIKNPEIQIPGISEDFRRRENIQA